MCMEWHMTFLNPTDGIWVVNKKAGRESLPRGLGEGVCLAGRGNSSPGVDKKGKR